MPRRRNDYNELNPPNIQPQIIQLKTETPIHTFCADYLKKNYWEMAKAVDKKFECSICLEEIDCKTGCERCFSVLTCGPVFHLPCIIKCRPLSCPLCRLQTHPSQNGE